MRTWRALASAVRGQLDFMTGRPRRQDFLRLLPKDSVGAEIGVFRGEFTRWILDIAQPSRLHLIDAWWELFGERYPDWGAYTDFGRLSTRRAFADAQRVVADHDTAGAAVFHVSDDRECLKGFADGYFDWVYLDSSHECEHTRSELQILSSKVKRDGLIAGDDWQPDPNHPHHGVCRAVTEFCLDGEWRLAKLDRCGQWCIHRTGATVTAAARGGSR